MPVVQLSFHKGPFSSENHLTFQGLSFVVSIRSFFFGCHKLVLFIPRPGVLKRKNTHTHTHTYTTNRHAEGRENLPHELPSFVLRKKTLASENPKPALRPTLSQSQGAVVFPAPCIG